MTRIALLLGLCAALPAVTFAAGKPLHGPHPMNRTTPLPSAAVADLIAHSPFIPDGTANLTLAQDPNWGTIPPEYFDFNQADGTYDIDYRVFQRSDGGYWVAGLHRPTDGSVNDEIAIVKLDADGTVDETYGNSGYATITSGLYVIYDVAMDDQNQLYFAGEAHTGAFPDYDFAVQCVDTTGAPCADFSFTETYFFDRGGDNNDYPTRIIFANGSLYVTGTVDTAGTSTTNDVAIGIVKINPADGTPDVAFGDHGDGTAVFNINYFSDGYDAPYDIAYAPTGKLVLVGTTQASSSNDDYDALILVVDANSGAADTSFGGGGYERLYFDLGDTERYDQFSAVTVLRNGNYVVVGFSANDTPPSDEFIAADFLPSGDLDETFADSGSIHTLLASSINRPQGVVEKKNGNLVVPMTVLNDVLGSAAGDGYLTAILEFDGLITVALSLQTVEIDGSTGIDTEPAAIIVDRQQRVVVGGWRDYNGTDYDMWANRYIDLDAIFDDGFDGN